MMQQLSKALHWGQNLQEAHGPSEDIQHPNHSPPIELKAGSQKKYLHGHVHSLKVHDNQKVEASQLSTDRWVNKQTGKYGVLKTTEILTHPEDILLSEIGESQR